MFIHCVLLKPKRLPRFKQIALARDHLECRIILNVSIVIRLLNIALIIMNSDIRRDLVVINKLHLIRL